MTSTIDTGVEIRQVSASTPGLQSRKPAFTEIPVVDFAPMRREDPEGRLRLAQSVYRACTEVGFFYIKNHGVEKEAIEQLFDTSHAFFAMSEESKLKIDISKSSFSRGYIPMCGEKNNEHSKGDLKETFDMAIEVAEDDEDFMAGNPLYGPNQWPEDLPQFQPSMNRHFKRMTDLSLDIYRAFALSLGLSEDFFEEMVDKPLDILRLLRYPPQPVVEDDAQIGTGAHSDFDCFTILYQDEVGGLQAINSAGEWVDAPPVEGCFLINVGDMMERWTNGLFVSTIHRVVNKSQSERYSTVFFAAPNYHVQIACLPGCSSPEHPPKYPPVSAGDYIISRYEAVLV